TGRSPRPAASASAPAGHSTPRAARSAGRSFRTARARRAAPSWTSTYPERARPRLAAEPPTRVALGHGPRLPRVRRGQPLPRGARRLHPPPGPAARATYRPVGGDRRAALPRRRRAREPRGDEPDLRPDRQAGGDARLLPRQPRGPLAPRVP